MAQPLVDALEDEMDDLPPELSGDAVDRILTGPQQERLAEALAADLVDAVPLVGDLLMLSRIEKAEERGIEYPERPTALENALSDLPPPIDTIADLAISQNAMHYLEEQGGVDVASLPNDVTGDVAENVNSFVGSLTDQLPDRR